MSIEETIAAFKAARSKEKENATAQEKRRERR